MISESQKQWLSNRLSQSHHGAWYIFKLQLSTSRILHSCLCKVIWQRLKFGKWTFDASSRWFSELLRILAHPRFKTRRSSFPLWGGRRISTKPCANHVIYISMINTANQWESATTNIDNTFWTTIRQWACSDLSAIICRMRVSLGSRASLSQG